jgi:phage shock protein C
MQRIIQITIAGRIIPIEDNAYERLKNYLAKLDTFYNGEPGKEEILQDIENRIAELFQARINSGDNVIDLEDVEKVIATLGDVDDLASDQGRRYQQAAQQEVMIYKPIRRRLFRDRDNKMLGGVCSGMGSYFDIDPIIPRLVFLLAFLGFGSGLLIYLIAWVLVPEASTPEEIRAMKYGDPIDTDQLRRNVEAELGELQKRTEKMSRDLKDYFSRKKH